MEKEDWLIGWTHYEERILEQTWEKGEDRKWKRQKLLRLPKGNRLL
jgi:hypothetical protein